LNNQNPSLKPAILALIALSLIWGYNWVVMKESLRYCSPADFATLRTSIGAAVLFAVLLVQRKSLRPKEIPMTIVLGLLSTTGSIGLVTWALETGGVGKTAVLVYTMPFWVILMAWPVLAERIRGMQWITVLLAFSGLLIILEPWNLHSSLFSKIMAILAGLSWAASAIVAKIMRRRTEFDLVSLTTWQMIFGAIPLIAFSLMAPSPPIRWTNYFVGALIYSSVVSNSLAVLLWYYILHKLPAGIASLGTLATPVIGVILAFIQLGERPSLWEGLGMVLIVAALALISFLGVMQYRRLKTVIKQD
jgi:drug/metabolite transporter (DMT)-like permease